MRFGSVCSGIEAASVAFGPLGWDAAWFSEIEPFPSAVLAHHYPDVPNLGDMTGIVRRLLQGEVEAPDVLCGGTPCQAFSVAGKRESLSDERGNLSLTFCEIANAIDHVRAARGDQPAIVFWENVPGVLNTRDNAFGCFLGALAGSGCELQPSGGRWTDAGCVYGPQRAVAWRVLDAQYFGLAQRRRRVFVVASARDGFDPASVLFESDGVRRDSAPRRETGQGAAASLGQCAASGWGGVAMGSGQAGAEVITDGGAPTLTCLHEAPIVAMPTAPIVGCINSAGGHSVPGNSVQDAMAHQLIPMLAHTLKAEGFDASEDGTGRGTPLVPVAFDTTQITIAANYSNPQPGDPCHPLAAGAHAPAIATTMAVRRLTPRECERLQGFPDDYTAIPWRKKAASECPDGPRYKALGNSWAVPCVRWIGGRIARAAA